MDRRVFLSSTIALAATSARSTHASGAALAFDLSLVESSLTRSLASKVVDHLDVASIAKNDFGIEAVEYASEFFPGQAPPTEDYLKEMNKRAAKHNIRQLLIAVDASIRISDPDKGKRMKAGQLIRQWIDAAKSLGCHSVQINPASRGSAVEQHQRTVEALMSLCQYADLKKINVLLGNYGDVSADAEWVAGVIKAVDSPSCRTLPRIRNFQKDTDYQNLSKLIPLAKGVTADTLKFDDQGNETTTDYVRAMKTVHEAGYRGYVGINYRGELGEREGIQATIALLERVRKEENQRVK